MKCSSSKAEGLPLKGTTTKGDELQFDGDSGLMLSGTWESSLEPKVDGINDKKLAAAAAIEDQGDSGLGIELRERFESLSCSEEARVPLSGERVRELLKSAEEKGEHCRRVVSRIHPSLRRRLVDEAFAADKDGDTRLHLAVVHGRIDIIFTLIYLVPHPQYLNVQNDLCQTALHLSVLTGDWQVVRRLVLAGASTVLRDRRGNTPLHLACEGGDYECVKQLTRPVTALEVQYLHLMNSASCGLPLPRIWLPQDLEIPNYEGKTCVHLATLNGHTDILLWLKKLGANINAQEGKSGRTPLAFAVEAKNLNLVEFLVEECEADVEAKNFAGFSAFQIAIRIDAKLANHLQALGALPHYQGFSSDEEDEYQSMEYENEEEQFYNLTVDEELW